MKKILLTSLTTALLLLSGCDSKDDLSKVQKDAPAEVTKYTLQDPRGEQLTIKDAAHIDFGHDKDYTLVVFWASWCEPCKAEIPHLVNIQNEYEDKIKVIASLVEQDKPNSELLDFMESYGMNYFVSNGSDEFAFSKLIAKKIGLSQINSIPALALFKDGEYVSHWIGPTPEEMITSHIK
ncbi:MAG: TlpA family protein disulfide reductase [Campylobacterota bacterium]